MTDAPTIIATSPVLTVEVVDLREYSFNEYISYRAEIGRPINGDREAFYIYLPEYTHRHRYTLNCWWMWWDRFVQWRDAICDRYDDWDDERHDPHLDAFI